MEKIVKTEAEWRAQLTPEQYRITRQHGTEPAFCGGLWDHHLNGVYHCVCCDLPLFASDSKFDSGTGWPSYFQPVAAENVTSREDNSFFMRRVEVLCGRCGGHLGHQKARGNRERINISVSRIFGSPVQRGSRALCAHTRRRSAEMPSF